MVLFGVLTDTPLLRAIAYTWIIKKPLLKFRYGFSVVSVPHVLLHDKRTTYLFKTKQIKLLNLHTTILYFFKTYRNDYMAYSICPDIPYS